MQTVQSIPTSDAEGVTSAAKKGTLIPRFTPFTLVWTSNEVHTENMNCVITFTKPLQDGNCAIRDLITSSMERGKGLGRACAALFLNEACEFIFNVSRCWLR